MLKILPKLRSKCYLIILSGKIAAETRRVVIPYVPIGCQAQLFQSAESGPIN